MDKKIHEENAKKILEDEKFQKNDTEKEYRYDDDSFEMEQSFEEEKEKEEKEEPCEERDWEKEERLCRL